CRWSELAVWPIVASAPLDCLRTSASPTTARVSTSSTGERRCNFPDLDGCIAGAAAIVVEAVPLADADVDVRVAGQRSRGRRYQGRSLFKDRALDRAPPRGIEPKANQSVRCRAVLDGNQAIAGAEQAVGSVAERAGWNRQRRQRARGDVVHVNA